LRVFEDDDAVAVGGELGLPVVDAFGDPDAAALVDVHARGVDDAGLAGPGAEGDTVGEREGLLDFLGRLHAGPRLLLQGDGDRDRGKAEAHLIRVRKFIDPATEFLTWRRP